MFFPEGFQTWWFFQPADLGHPGKLFPNPPCLTIGDRRAGKKLLHGLGGQKAQKRLLCSPAKGDGMIGI